MTGSKIEKKRKNLEHTMRGLLEKSGGHPKMIKRAGAFLIDYILGSITVSVIPMIITSIITGEKALTVISFTSMPLVWQGISCLIALFAAIFYYCLYPMKTKHLGQTPGKRVMKIRVERMEGAGKSGEHGLTYKNIFLRELIGSFVLEGETAFPSAFGRYFLYLFLPVNVVTVLSGASVILSVISLLWAFFNPSHRMIHDYVGGTVVVHAV